MSLELRIELLTKEYKEAKDIYINYIIHTKEVDVIEDIQESLREKAHIAGSKLLCECIRLYGDE